MEQLVRRPGRNAAALVATLPGKKNAKKGAGRAYYSPRVVPIGSLRPVAQVTFDGSRILPGHALFAPAGRQVCNANSMFPVLVSDLPGAASLQHSWRPAKIDGKGYCERWLNGLVI